MKLFNLVSGQKFLDGKTKQVQLKEELNKLNIVKVTKLIQMQYFVKQKLLNQKVFSTQLTALMFFL